MGQVSTYDRAVAERPRRPAADHDPWFRDLFDDAPIGLALVRRTGRRGAPKLVRVNRELCDMLSLSEAELLAGRAVGAPGRGGVPQPLAELASRQRLRERAELPLRRGDGSTCWALVVTSRPDARAGELLVQVVDVTARKEAQDRLVHQAYHDELTGLPNRRLLVERLAEAAGRARRTRASIGLLFVDLDDFKAVNDTHGHGAGDDVLVETARRLARGVRSGDTVARLGGDEFVVLVQGASHRDLQTLAARLARALRAPMRLRNAELTVSASIGGTLSGAPAGDPAELLDEADAALLRVKRGRAGRRFERRRNPAAALGPAPARRAS
jgi:diguanylate cyclase (GGDEF)-like protein/PAS domain S-box-containing protein